MNYQGVSRDGYTRKSLAFYHLNPWNALAFKNKQSRTVPDQNHEEDQDDPPAPSPAPDRNHEDNQDDPPAPSPAPATEPAIAPDDIISSEDKDTPRVCNVYM